MKKPLILVFLICVVLLGSCGRRAKIRNNPLLNQWEGVYGLPPFSKMQASDFLPALDEAMKRQLDSIELIKGNSEAASFENVIVALDNSGVLLDRVRSVYSLMAAVDSSSVLVAAEEDIATRLSTHKDIILHDRELFNKVASVYNSLDDSGLDPQQKRVVERMYEAFVRGGALLGEPDKETIRTINADLAKREVAFSRHVIRASKESYILGDSTDIAGLSYMVRDSTRKMAVAAGADSLFLFLLDEPIVTPVLTASTIAPFRERLYTAYRKRCEKGDANDNLGLVADITGLRDQKARLLGFDSYSDYSATGMLEGSGGVYSLLDEIWDHALDKAVKEDESRRQLMPAGDSSALNSWDLLHYNDRLVKKETGMDGEQIEVFFSLDNVRIGAFELANRLWGLTFRPVQTDLYSSDCEAYEVFDIDGSLLGLFVMDYYSRMGKKPGTALYPLSYEGMEGQESPVPAVCMVFNFTRPQNASRPSLLSEQQVSALFRAVGNSLERLFVNVPYRALRDPDQSISGLAGELMRCWAFNTQMLTRYALHYSTGKLPPKLDLEHIAAIPQMFSGTRTAELTAAAYMDMDIHSRGDIFTNEETFELEHLREKRDMPQFIDPEYRLSAFSEVFGKDGGASYYARLWNEVLAADVFSRFRPGGNIFDRRIAAPLREKVFSKGGSASAAELYRNFMGRDASTQAFLVAKGFIDPPPVEERPIWEEPEEDTEAVVLEGESPISEGNDGANVAQSEETEVP